MKNKINATKGFVRRHQGVIFLTTVAVMQARGIHKLNGFLEEKGLFNEYYKLDEI